ncbi:hypothetical protein [Sulfurifustis variabilis]|uniref:hypothetical protein n=1 Tax=Sulfurifustis variabilis TaxID=1675686 RepID=UPI001472D1DC|nr:hypothetical protein [Sulfurifustis variabilis]
MLAKLKILFVGVVLGAVIAFPLGMNHGRGAPLLSNPFARRDLGDSVKEKAEALVEGAREKLHEVTRPEPKRDNR